MDAKGSYIIKRRMFLKRVNDRIEGANVDHAGFSNALLNSAREVCGKTTRRRQRDRETWWWNEEKQLAVREKKLPFKKWQSEGTEKNRQAKRKVAIAKDRAWKYWSESLQSNEGRAKMFKIAKQMRKERKDIIGSKYVRNENGTLKVKEEESYGKVERLFSSLLNKTNEYQLEEEDKVKGLIWGVAEQIVEQALKSMKVGKALGPFGVTL